LTEDEDVSERKDERDESKPRSETDTLLEDSEENEQEHHRREDSTDSEPKEITF